MTRLSTMLREQAAALRAGKPVGPGLLLQMATQARNLEDRVVLQGPDHTLLGSKEALEGVQGSTPLSGYPPGYVKHLEAQIGSFAQKEVELQEEKEDLEEQMAALEAMISALEDEVEELENQVASLAQDLVEERGHD